MWFEQILFCPGNITKEDKITFEYYISHLTNKECRFNVNGELTSDDLVSKESLDAFNKRYEDGCNFIYKDADFIKNIKNSFAYRIIALDKDTLQISASRGKYKINYRMSFESLASTQMSKVQVIMMIIAELNRELENKELMQQK